MHSFLDQDKFYLKDRPSTFGANNNFDILDPNTQELILTCREEERNDTGKFSILFFFSSRRGPIRLNFRNPEGELIYIVDRTKKWFTLSYSVQDHNGVEIGFITELGGGFRFVSSAPKRNYTMQGMEYGGEFAMVKNHSQLAKLDKLHAQSLKEFITSGGEYLLTINKRIAKEDPWRAVALCTMLPILNAIPDD